MLILQFKHKTCSNLGTDSTFDHTQLNVPEMYMQLPHTVFALEMNTCSVVRVYFLPQLIRDLHTKRFLVHNLKGKPKHPRVFQKYCSICNYITWPSFSLQEAAMFVY